MAHPHIDSIGFTTGDGEASASFFSECLGFQRAGATQVVDGGPYGDLVGLPGARYKLVQE